MRFVSVYWQGYLDLFQRDYLQKNWKFPSSAKNNVTMSLKVNWSCDLICHVRLRINAKK